MSIDTNYQDFSKIPSFLEKKSYISGVSVISLNPHPEIFWKEITEWLYSSAIWKTVKIGTEEIARGKIILLAALDLLISPELLPTIAKISEDCLRLLLHSKIDPIVRATYLGDLALVKALLKQGSSPSLVMRGYDALDFRGHSLLDVAILSGHSEIVELLMSEVATRSEDPHISLSLDHLKESPDILKILIKHGFLVAKEDFGGTPIHWAIREDNLDELNYWLDLGASVDICGKAYPFTPLQLAVKLKKSKAAYQLLKRGANASLALPEALNYNPFFTESLIKYGAQVSNKVFELAKNVEEIEVFELLLKNYKELDEKCLINLLIELFSKKIPFLSFSPVRLTQGTEPSTSDFQKVRILLEKIKCSEIKGMPLLHWVTIYDEELAISMIKGGANPHLITSAGITVLHLAALLNLQSLATTLIEKKVDLLVRDYTGATPLNHALNYYKTHSLATQLIQEGGMKNINEFYLYNSYKLLRIKWLSPLIKKDPLLHAKWKEMNLGKLCAHLYDLKGVHKIDDTLSILREGMISPTWLIKKIGQCTKNMKGLDSKILQKVVAVCEFTANPSLTDENYVAQIKADEPVVVIKATECHYVYILFYKDAYVYCDGNFDSITIQRYNRDSLTEEMIKRLRFGCSIVDPERLAKELKESVEATLEVKKESSDAKYQSSLWVKQSVGNCNWKSFEMAMHALVLLENGSMDFIAAWLSNLKETFASQYISNVKQGIFLPDQELLTVIENGQKEPSCFSGTNVKEAGFSQFIVTPGSSGVMGYYSFFPK